MTFLCKQIFRRVELAVFLKDWGMEIFLKSNVFNESDMRFH